METTMEDLRTYRVIENDNDRQTRDEEREYESASRDEVPFHIPRD
jgi:hypothetical protein